MPEEKSESPMIEKLIKEHAEKNVSTMTITAMSDKDNTGAEYTVQASGANAMVIMGMAIAMIQAVRDNLFNGDSSEAIAAIMTSFAMADVNEKEGKENE